MVHVQKQGPPAPIVGAVAVSLQISVLKAGRATWRLVERGCGPARVPIQGLEAATECLTMGRASCPGSPAGQPLRLQGLPTASHAAHSAAWPPLRPMLTGLPGNMQLSYSIRKSWQHFKRWQKPAVNIMNQAVEGPGREHEWPRCRTSGPAGLSAPSAQIVTSKCSSQTVSST